MVGEVPRGTSPIGPFPPGLSDSEEDRDAYDRLRRSVLWSMPSGIYIVGSAAEGRVNLMTANLCFQLSVAPKLVGVSLEADSLTLALIRSGGCFTVSFLARRDRDLARRFAKPLSDDGHDSRGERVAMRRSISGAPILEGAAAWMDCSLVREIELGSHSLCVGEVSDVGRSDEGDGVELLRMEDTRMSYGG